MNFLGNNYFIYSDFQLDEIQIRPHPLIRRGVSAGRGEVRYVLHSTEIGYNQSPNI